MRTNVSTLYIPAMALCCLLVVRATVSSAGEAPGPAGTVNSIPNMACTPSLPRQQERPPRQWNNCVGTYTYQNGNVYSGEFRHGDRHGLGVLEIKFIGQSSATVIGWDEPAIYVGSFRDGFRDGYGLLIAKSGVAYAGSFKDNFAQSELTQKECKGDISAAWTNCIGMYRFPNGNVYRGEFKHGVPEGIGMLQVSAEGSPEAAQVRLPVPGIYVGQFMDGKLSGQGAVVMPGAGYFGTFSDNMFKPDGAASSGRDVEGGHEASSSPLRLTPAATFDPSQGDSVQQSATETHEARLMAGHDI